MCYYNHGFTSNAAANLISREDNIGFIFLDCRGNTPEGEQRQGAIRTLEPHCNRGGRLKNILILFKERNSWLSGNRGKGLQMKSVGMVQRRWLLFLQVFVAIAALCMQGRPPIITSIDAYTPVSTPEIHFRGMSPYRRPGGSPLEGHNKELDNPENKKNKETLFSKPSKFRTSVSCLEHKEDESKYVLASG